MASNAENISIWWRHHGRVGPSWCSHQWPCKLQIARRQIGSKSWATPPPIWLWVNIKYYVPNITLFNQTIFEKDREVGNTLTSWFLTRSSSHDRWHNALVIYCSTLLLSPICGTCARYRNYLGRGTDYHVSSFIWRNSLQWQSVWSLLSLCPIWWQRHILSHKLTPIPDNDPAVW